MMFENDHFAAFIVITDLVKNYQWILRPVDFSLMKNRISTQFQSTPRKIINYKEENGTLEWINLANII